MSELFESDPDDPAPVSDEDEASCALSGPELGESASLDEQQLKDWIAGVVRQDEAALASLYHALIGRVYGVVLRIVRHAATAEEVAEDTFWQVWRQAPRFDPERGKAVTWVLMMARSRALDALRQRSRMPCAPEYALSLEVGLAGPDPEGAQAATPGEAGMGADPLDLLGALQESHQVRRCLEQLEPVGRQMVALAFYRGLSHQEIAEHTGVPLGTVKSHIRRALVALRGWIESVNELN